MTYDFKRLYKELDKFRASSQMSWRKLGAQSDVAPATFTRLKQGKKIGIPNLVKLTESLGVSIQKFLR